MHRKLIESSDLLLFLDFSIVTDVFKLMNRSKLMFKNVKAYLNLRPLFFSFIYLEIRSSNHQIMRIKKLRISVHSVFDLFYRMSGVDRRHLTFNIGFHQQNTEVKFYFFIFTKIILGRQNINPDVLTLVQT